MKAMANGTLYDDAMVCCGGDVAPSDARRRRIQFVVINGVGNVVAGMNDEFTTLNEARARAAEMGPEFRGDIRKVWEDLGPH